MAGAAQLVRASSHNQKKASLIPSQGTCLGCRSYPWFHVCMLPVWVHTGGSQLMFLPLSLEPMKRKSLDDD